MLKPVNNTVIKPWNKVSFSLSNRALDIASAQIGVKELTGNNDGVAVETFLKSVGLGKGYAWCMAFVYWCYKTAGEELNVSNPLIKTGGVLNMWNKIDSKYKFNTPKRGDIFIMDFGKGLGHTGFVTGVNGGIIDTVEGNTNKEGSRNGNGVYARTRSIKSIKGYIRVNPS